MRWNSLVRHWLQLKILSRLLSRWPRSSSKRTRLKIMIENSRRIWLPSIRRKRCCRKGLGLTQQPIKLPHSKENGQSLATQPRTKLKAPQRPVNLWPIRMPLWTSCEALLLTLIPAMRKIPGNRRLRELVAANSNHMEPSSSTNQPPLDKITTIESSKPTRSSSSSSQSLRVSRARKRIRGCRKWVTTFLIWIGILPAMVRCSSLSLIITSIFVKPIEIPWIRKNKTQISY